MTNTPTPETDAMPADNSVFWSARDGTGEMQHHKASPAEASKIIERLTAERNALRADVAGLRTALDGMLIAEMKVRQMDGFAADEVEAEPHWMAARAALAERDRLKADITGDIADMTLSLTAERDALRADATQLRDVLQRIVSNGGSATNVMLFDARTALAQ